MRPIKPEKHEVRERGHPQTQTRGNNRALAPKLDLGRVPGPQPPGNPNPSTVTRIPATYTATEKRQEDAKTPALTTPEQPQGHEETRNVYIRE